jgi:hypothetical protein
MRTSTSCDATQLSLQCNIPRVSLERKLKILLIADAAFFPAQAGEKGLYRRLTVQFSRVPFRVPVRPQKDPLRDHNPQPGK